MRRFPAPHRRRPAVAAVLAGLLAATALAGCATESTVDQAEPTATSSADADAFPVTIEHAFGETTVTEEPERVATLGWTDQDNAVALGVVPVGATKMTWGGNDQGSSDWFDAAVAEAGGEAPVRYDDSDGTPISEVAATQPDLILATNSGITKQDYQRLSKIAPVIAYPEAPWVTPWQVSLETAGKALGRSSRAEEVRAETEDEVAAAREEHADLQGTTFLFTFLSAADLSSVGVYAPADPRVRVLEDLGLESAPVVDDIVEDGEFYGSVSAERAGTLESDLVLTYAEDESDLKTFRNDPLVGQLPALEAGHAYAEADKEIGLAMTNPSPLSMPVIIDTVLPRIEASMGDGDA